MRLYKSERKLIEYEGKKATNEAHIQNFIEEHPETIGKDIMIIGNEVQAGKMGIIDLLGIDKAGRVVIMELKKGQTPRTVVSQILFYAQWAVDIGVDELDRIARKRHLDGHPNLHEKTKAVWGKAPKEWNKDQRMYIISEETTPEVIDVCRYLKQNGMKINCVNVGFHYSDDKRIISTDIIPGDEDEFDYGNMGLWERAIASAEEDVRTTIEKIISTIESECECKGSTYEKVPWYRFSTHDTGTAFAIIYLGKKNSSFGFMSEDDFGVDNDHMDSSNFLFRSGRSVLISSENLELIIKCAKHAYETARKKTMRMTGNAQAKEWGHASIL